jgi:hypothetical protein
MYILELTLNASLTIAVRAYQIMGIRALMASPRPYFGQAARSAQTRRPEAADLRKYPIAHLKNRDLMEIHDKIPSAWPTCNSDAALRAAGRPMNEHGSQHEGFGIVGVRIRGAVLLPPGTVIAAVGRSV